MLQKRTLNNGVVCLISPLMERAGVPHAFSTRIGGVSRGAFASLNLGNPSGSPIRDADENISQNHQRLFSGLGLTDRKLCRVHQVHGCDLVTLRQGDGPPHGKQADALLSDSADLMLSVRIADCVPILVADAAGKQVAAVHAGWRGVVAGMLPVTLSAMHREGINPKDLLVAIGPCISIEAFEVGDEVAAEFERVFPGQGVIDRPPSAKPHVNLRLAVKLQALHLGIPEDQIDTTDLCTFRDAELFFSHRRDQGLTGRMAAVIAAKA